LTGGQQNTSNITSGQFGMTVRHSCLRNKKIKTPPTHKINLNFYCHCTSGTFAFAATREANPEAKAKEPLLPTPYSFHSKNLNLVSLLCRI